MRRSRCHVLGQPGVLENPVDRQSIPETHRDQQQQLESSLFKEFKREGESVDHSARAPEPKNSKMAGSREKLMLRALGGEACARPPIWLMRQAGRYLPEYRATRARAPSFIEFCLTPELAMEATLQPIRRFGFDAAILFSDIMVIPYALGQKVWFEEGRGPCLEPVGSVAELDPLPKNRIFAALQLPQPLASPGTGPSPRSTDRSAARSLQDRCRPNASLWKNPWIHPPPPCNSRQSRALRQSRSRRFAYPTER